MTPSRIRLYLVLLISLPWYVACKQPSPISYQAAHQACLEAQQKLWDQNGGKFVRFPWDCLMGSVMPDSIGYTVTGKLIDPTFYKNKITLVNFWFETCPPCVEEIPYLNQLVDQFGHDQFNYLGVGKETDADIRLFMAKHNWQFDQMLDGKRLIEEIFKPIWGYPKTMVVNEDGVIINMWGGIFEKNYPDIVAELDSLQKKL